MLVRRDRCSYLLPRAQALKPRGKEWEHLGSLGPALYAEVGDVLVVVFRNNLPFPVNMAPTGGLTIAPDRPGKAVVKSVRRCWRGHVAVYKPCKRGIGSRD